ncbi:MAG: hypothetical protein II715_05760 [Clostridia bacterium]|nr:hypothetical protein [Clostridia bacterium]
MRISVLDDDREEVFKLHEMIFHISGKNKTEPRHTLTVRIDRAVNVLYQDEIIRVEGHGHNFEH